MKKVLLTEEFHSSLSEGLRNTGFKCECIPGITQEQIIKSAHNYYGIIVATRVSINKEIIDRAINLKFIARAGSGMENIDVVYAQQKNILCINSPEGNANSVGEHCVGLLLTMFHNITKSSNEIRNGKWMVNENLVHELDARIIGIIGYGNTGRSFAEKLKPFGITVLAYDRYLKNYGNEFARESNMNDIFLQSDIISFHVPLNHETNFMVNNDYLSMFKKNIYLINSSRGKIINHKDLYRAVQSGKIIFAALDVFENENFDNQTTEEKTVFNNLLFTEKVIFTPHIAGKSFESKKKIAEVLLKKILALA